MPVQVLTGEEIEKIVEEKLKKVLSDLQIMKKIDELEASTAKLTADLNKLSTMHTQIVTKDPLAAALMKDLAGLAGLLEIQTQSDSVTLKVRARLRDQDFRTIRETVQEHGGFWSQQRKMFIVPRNSRAKMLGSPTIAI
jgi:hypothetical protein